MLSENRDGVNLFSAHFFADDHRFAEFRITQMFGIEDGKGR